MGNVIKRKNISQKTNEQIIKGFKLELLEIKKKKEETKKNLDQAWMDYSNSLGEFFSLLNSSPDDIQQKLLEAIKTKEFLFWLDFLESRNKDDFALDPLKFNEKIMDSIDEIKQLTLYKDYLDESEIRLIREWEYFLFLD